MRELVFLGTGGAWGVPEIACGCRICSRMRELGERRGRAAMLLRGERNFLIDCGPDIREQIQRNSIPRPDALFITHEHGDHFLGMDELFCYKRNVPRDGFKPIPVYLSSVSWDVIRLRFGYLEQLGVISPRLVEPGRWFEEAGLEAMAFKTEHGKTAAGSVGFVFRLEARSGRSVRLVYTSDFVDIPEVPKDCLEPDILVIQSFWLNEPVENRPSHMSLQRALGFMERLSPRTTYITHMGDADMVEGDPWNTALKKYRPKDPLRPSPGKAPYPIPLCQSDWEETLEAVLSDKGMPHEAKAAYDDMTIGI